MTEQQRIRRVYDELGALALLCRSQIYRLESIREFTRDKSLVRDLDILQKNQRAQISRILDKIHQADPDLASALRDDLEGDEVAGITSCLDQLISRAEHLDQIEPQVVAICKKYPVEK